MKRIELIVNTVPGIMLTQQWQSKNLRNNKKEGIYSAAKVQDISG
jgi:hypothetical protein